MIIYNKLWNELHKKGISQYKLIHEYGISTGQLDRIRKNGNINTYTLNTLCKILGCNLEDIAEYVPDNDSTESGK
ncbi:MAG: helix-turn-helix transcriptional regulator [Eubacteriales bacterium]|nr:helix-turn-helix transcriptional regulator [Eubacteriales bacterium]